MCSIHCRRKLRVNIRNFHFIFYFDYILLRRKLTIIMTLGIDVGGTNIVLGLVENGRILHKESFESFAEGCTLDETLSYLKSLIGKVITPDVSGIGIGVPSVVDLEEGVVYDTANIPSWKEVPLRRLLVNEYGLPVQVNNDANCYALGAWWTLPESNRPGTMVAVTLGTGVGIGIVVDGKLFCGANCGAGELCCLPYRDKTIEDYCGKKFFCSKGVSPIEMKKAAMEGDARAIALFEEYGRELGNALRLVLLAYDPHCIVLGGGLSNNFKLFEKSLMQSLREIFPYQKTIDKLRIEVVNDDSVPMLGAASLI